MYVWTIMLMTTWRYSGGYWRHNNLSWRVTKK